MKYDTYLVVLNEDGQYSVWPADREIPAGWRAEGAEGSRQHCLEHIGRVWADMRPLSLRCLRRLSRHGRHLRATVTQLFLSCQHRARRSAQPLCSRSSAAT
jgi:MbtH protein